MGFFSNHLPEKQISFVFFKNFIEIFQDPDFIGSIWHTIVYVFSVSAIHLVLAVVLAAFFDKHIGLIGKVAYAMRAVIIIPWLLSWTVAASIWLLILNPSGVLNGFLLTAGSIEEVISWLGTLKWAMFWIIMITVWKSFPFFFMLTYAALITVPNELYESAEIDGAKAIQKFFRITLPMIVQTLMTLTALDIIWCIRQYVVIALTTGGGPLNSTKTLSVKIYQTAFESLKFGQASAQGGVVLLLSAAIAIIYIRLYTRTEEV
jgi:ABC-type sugar transport system permease subunit